ncbi:MAG: DUF4968 domain-containing protein [Bacteroidales bacterium]
MALIFVFRLASNAQTYQKTDFGVTTVINAVQVEIKFYSPSIVRIIKYPEGKTFEKQSLSVVKTPQKTAFSVKLHGNELSLKSEKIEVLLNLKTGMVAFANQAMQLLSEKES